MNTANTVTRLSRALRFAAAATFLSIFGLWAGTGARLGWTQTSKVVFQHDEIAGIDFPVREKTFVAGIEVLGVGIVAAGAFAGAAFIVSRRQRAAAARA